MEPNGYLIIRLAANPEPEDFRYRPIELRIPFKEMLRWEPMQQCLRIEFPDKRVLIPWWNILDVECHFNSSDYVQEQKRYQEPEIR